MLDRLISPGRDTSPAPVGQPDTEYPRAMQVETTSICNLRCTMCPTTHFPTNKNLDTGLFEAVLTAVPHIEGIVPFLGGEPLLYRHFFELLERVRACSESVFIGFNSNATMFDDQACSRLVDLQVSEVIVSMDGATADTYNRIRVRGDFDTTVGNIRRLVQTKGTARFPALGLMLVASRQNVHEVPGLVRLAVELGLQKIIINGLEPYSAESARQVCYAPTPDPKIVDLFQAAADEARRLGILFQGPDLRVTREKLYCPALSVCIIRADGQVYPCYQYSTDDPFYYHDRQTQHLGPLSFGNISKTSIHDIWCSAPYREFRERLRQRYFHAECHQCLVAEGLVCNMRIYPL